MYLNLSIFKDIDFANKENLLFLFISLVIVLAIFVFSIMAIIAVLKALKKLLVRLIIIIIKPKKRKNQNDSESVESVDNTQSEKPAGYNYQPFNTGGIKIASESKTPMELINQKAEDNNDIRIPTKHTAEGGFMKNLNVNEKTSDKEPVNATKNFAEKEKNNILGHLEKLKAGSDKERDTLESKMPSRTPNEEGDTHKKIEIPRSSDFHEKSALSEKMKNLKTAKGKSSTDSEFMKLAEKMIEEEKKLKEKKKDDKGVTVSSELHGSKLTYEKETIEAAKKTVQENKKGFLKSLFGVSNKEKQKIENKNLPHIDNKKPNKVVAKNNVPAKKPNDGSIFGGKTEISRKELEYQLRINPQAWQAARSSKMYNLSPVERSKLIKDIPAFLGKDISTQDIKSTIRILNRNLLDAKGDPKKYETIRKKISFFKKIGGVK